MVFPIVPALVMISDEKAKHKRALLKDKCNRKNYYIQDADVEKSEQITKYLDECRMALLSFKRNELSIELVTQLSVHVTMILLSRTKYPVVETGIQSIFQDNKEEEENSRSALILLILSVLWSFKTTAITSMNIKTETKNFLPIFPKVLLATR